MSHRLATNAISSLIVTGSIEYPYPRSLPIILNRITTPVDLVPAYIAINNDSVVPGTCTPLPAPPRKLPILPSPNDISLHVSVGQRIGYGATGLVHSVEVEGPIPVGVHIPPLVLKIARHSRGEKLAREAWAYDELATLQGAVVPRCFGRFEAEIDADFTTELDKWFPEPEDDHGRAVRGAADSTNPRVLSVLLLERMSNDKLPFRVPLAQSLQDDVLCLFEDLAHLGISHADIRYANIRRAPEYSFSSAHPGIACPRTGRMHEWRLIDLESCAKSNIIAEGIQFTHYGYVMDILDDLPLGHVPEPWDGFA